VVKEFPLKGGSRHFISVTDRAGETTLALHVFARMVAGFPAEEHVLVLWPATGG
jgi:hypothetical protein